MLIKNIKSLVQVRDNTMDWVSGADMQSLPAIDNSYLHIDGDKILSYGSMNNCLVTNDEEIIDATGKYVLPAFVDSHSHIIFAETREAEFVDKINGASYAEIAAKGGGILNSAKKLQKISADELFERAMPRVREVIGFGTGCLEIKSGYGLTVKDELKMLRVARRIGNETPLTVKTTFLGAHAIPKEFTNREDYIDLVINEMIPQVADENLADYIDVFCEEGFFTPSETERVIKAGEEYGMVPKIHANQLHISGGVEVGVKTGARSVDHLESMGEEQIIVLKNSKTMPTLLPGSAFFLNNDYPPARRMIDAGLPVALATDYNPGSAPAGKMAFMMSLACIKMKMTPEEALNAATINSAYAMDVLDTHGSISVGKAASIIITKPISGLARIPYSFTGDFIDKVILHGEVVFKSN
ncbi:MAG: imidazolonepropionase [Bacteroidetes bacterium]|nr:MAG: imidazolonepropionase [Bacteroidota bacterium]